MTYNIVHDKAKGAYTVNFAVDKADLKITPFMVDTGRELTPIICKDISDFYSHLGQFLDLGWRKA